MMPIHLCLRNFSAELYYVMLWGIFYFLGSCHENFLWADTQSSERRIFIKVSLGRDDRNQLPGPERERADGDRTPWCVAPEREGRGSRRSDDSTNAGLVGHMPLGCTPPCDRQPFGKARTLKMFQTSGFILEIPLNMSFLFSLPRVECEAAFRCL